MYISKVSLVNYRNFENSYFLFNKGINTIIGENASGKTNLFRAIRLILDDNLLSYAYKLNENDFNRNLINWKGRWIIISLEFSEISNEEAIQALFVYGSGVIADDKVKKATYNLFFRPKPEIRKQLSELKEGDHDGLNSILDKITINDYETFFTGKSTVDFNDKNVQRELMGDFENVIFNYEIDESKFGGRIPHQLSISKEVAFTFIKALRDVVSDFQDNKKNPLLTLLKSKSEELNEKDSELILNKVKELNKAIEDLNDIKEITNNISETIKEAVGTTYSPSSLSIKSNLPNEAEKLFHALKLFIGEPGEDYEGSIHELSLGGANLIFLTLKLLEYKDNIAQRIYQALENNTLPPYNNIDEPNNERKGLVAPVANHADVRHYILILAAGFVNTLMPGEDTLISKGFSVEEAKDTASAFEQYCREHCDEIEALRILYNQEGAPITYAMLKDLENKLKLENNKFSPKQLWNSYAIISPDHVRRATKKEESDALTNIIQLVRYAFRQIERLDCVCTTARQYFNLWCGQWHRDISDRQKQLMSQIVDYIAANGACTIRDIREDDKTQAAQMIAAFGGMKNADEALLSLFNFVVLRKTA